MSLKKGKGKQSSLSLAPQSRKISSKPSTSSATPTTLLEQISQLEKKITSNSSKNGDLNPLADLRECYDKATKLKVRVAAISALHNAFTLLIRQGKVIGKVRQPPAGEAGLAEHSKALLAVREWTKGRWNDYQDLLCDLLSNSEPALATTALNAFMSLLKTSSQHLSELQSTQSYSFDGALWKRIMQGLLAPPQAATAEVQAEFVNRYLNAYDDIRFYFLKSVVELAQTATSNISVFRATTLFMLESLTTMPTEEAQLNAFWAGEPTSKQSKRSSSSRGGPSKKRKRVQKDMGEIDTSTGIFDDSEDDTSDEAEAQATSQLVKKMGQHELLTLAAHRKAFSAAWRAFLGTGLTEDEIKRVLVMLHRQVLPHLVEPGMLVDFLADCTDYGRTVALLALNGLFTLITKHGLEYPNFFTKLYQLLDDDLLHVRYRPRFMRMLDIFLASPLLPVAMIASFIKRLARLSLQAPPAAIVTIIPFTYNQMKRHPALMTMIHSPSLSEDGTVYEDPYDFGEKDPLKTGALDSSLWELASMRKHYHPSVSTLAKIFEEAFTKPNYNMEDFYDHTYTTMFETETSRPIKKAPAFASKPASGDWKFLFPERSLPTAGDEEEQRQLELETKGDVVSQIWRFS